MRNHYHHDQNAEPCDSHWICTSYTAGSFCRVIATTSCYSNTFRDEIICSGGATMIRRMYRLLIGCLLLSITGHAQQSSPSITVTGTSAQPLLLTAADLAQMPRATATTTNGGVETRFE